MHEELCAQTAQRTESCLQQWQDDPAIRSVQSMVSKMVQEELRWPNAFFVPEDPFRLMLWPSVLQGESAVTDFMERLHNSMGLPADTLADALQLTYGEVVSRIVEQRQP